MIIIPFNKPPKTGNEIKYVTEAINSGHISGDGNFTKRCQTWFEENLPCKKALLTSSCTHSLECSAILLDLKPGDEVIMPSYTFVSTANAFALRGAHIVFVDIRPDTMNINETLIEAAITERTKAIVPIHYAGVACEMDVIMSLAEKYNLTVIEDAAQGMTSTYKGKALGTIGHIGTYSFHETKNYTSAGEGGLLIINDSKYFERAEIIREKGTNRSQFFRGMVDKYSWVDIGSSYLMNDISAAYLWSQIRDIQIIRNNRMKTWLLYHKLLKPLADKNQIIQPTIPESCEHNAHMYYIKVENLKERSNLITHLKDQGILSVFHYVPLHSAKAGIEYGQFHDKDIFTTLESERLLRLPLYYGITTKEVEDVTQAIYSYFKKANNA
ncbi:dTDP-4-amino-4,6-dideoxygalactose transaminase [Marinicella gelatinilytica]|uniref:dTDP-4-amino-4,6-dideoxygalactose transaminase n=1 Tax=Marinicella gelatinilytica TaxID=2996017 RepID=UPI002260906A|nr:dTDP-4-amino-4,6-dideoxygalactose transaminase [Marinicella gelatinilytica]MCX7544498.1 dTDP-4-amino-4,6-dideoxygalactose transaminase [Marinicella gelatinilytica]